MDFYFSPSSQNLPLSRCKRIFRSLIRLSLEELCETADSLIAPVRLGVARPTAPFSLATSNNDVINVSINIQIFTFIFFVRICRALKNYFWSIPSHHPSPMTQHHRKTYPTLTTCRISLKPYGELFKSRGKCSTIPMMVTPTAKPLSKITSLFFTGMQMDNDDDNASEHDDVPADRELPISSRQVSLNENDAAEAPSDQQEGVGGQGEDSDPELDLLAETESDSDDNHSNQDAASAQRSVQTGATAGSDTG